MEHSKMANNKMTTLLAFLTLSSFCFLASEACSCVPSNMRARNVGCKYEFMAIVNLTDVKHVEMDLYYHFELIEDRTPELATPRSLSGKEYIVTANNPATCGVYLEPNHLYLMKGSFIEYAQAKSPIQPHLNLCSSVYTKLTHLPSVAERKTLLDNLYKEQC